MNPTGIEENIKQIESIHMAWIVHELSAYRDIIHNGLCFVFDFLHLCFNFLSCLSFYCDLFQYLADRINNITKWKAASTQYRNRVA